MRIFVAGATGAVGSRLVPRLVSAGHAVVGLTRTPAKAEALQREGAQPVVADALDEAAMRDAVARARPEVLIHELTALADTSDLRRFDRSFAMSNRLRTEGTDHLVAAARAAGVRRIVAQSFCGWPYARGGAPAKSENESLDPDPPRELRRTLEAIRHVESAIAGASDFVGLVLRYGALYGPRTGIFGGPTVEAIRRRRFPLIDGGDGWWSFLHIDDAAAATALAVERGAAGLYNIVDDKPAPVRDWLPALARMLGAKPPRRLPRWLGRIVAGEHIVALMNDVHGGSNLKARRELGWRPAHASWRQGFAETVAQGSS
jgi:nucleoside-diphosphate-sugar epimerase